MPTIIDSLLLTLGLDTKAVKQGEAEATTSLKHLEVQAKESAREISEQGHVAGEFYDHMLEKAATFFAFIAGGMEMKEFVKGTMEAEISTSRLTEMLGLNIEEVQKWQGAVVLADGTVEGFQQSMKGLGGSLVDIEKNLPRAERALKVLQAAGITGLAKGKKADILEVLDQLSNKMKEMPLMEANRLGSRIGLDEAFIRVLRKGSEGIEELKNKAASLGMFTQQEANASEQLKEQWNALGLMGKSLARDTIMGIVMPALKVISDVLEKIGLWAKQHPDGMKATFIGMATGLTAAAIAAAGLTLTLSPVMATVAAASVAIGLLGAGAYEMYVEWDKWLPMAEALIPGSRGTLQVAKEGLSELTLMYKAFFAGNELEAEHHANKVMELFKDALMRFFRQLLWEVFDIPYKIVHFLKNMIGGAHLLANDLARAITPDTMKALTVPAASPFNMTTINPRQQRLQEDFFTADLNMDRRGMVPASLGMGGLPSFRVEQLHIHTPSTDPAEHAAAFSAAMEAEWANRVTAHANTGQ